MRVVLTRLIFRAFCKRLQNVAERKHEDDANEMHGGHKSCQ